MKIFLSIFSIFMLILPIKNYKFLSRINTTYMKGILQILIILHHISQNENNLKFIHYFANLGMYSVGIFFFISIYGLSKQLNLNREKYLSSFLRKRFLKIFLSIFIFTIIVLVVRIFILNENWNLLEIVNLYKKGSSLIVNGWYLNSILIIYLLFFFSFKIFKDNKKSYLLFSILILAYIFTLKKIGFGIWWYNSMIVLLFGIIFVNFEDKINFIFEKFYVIIFPISIFLFYAFEKYGYRIVEKFNLPISYFIFQSLMCLNFCIMFLLIFKKLSIRSKILEFLGNISFEMYMVHGILMKILNIYLKTDVVYIIFLFALTILTSYLLNILLKKTYNLCKI